MKAHSIFFLTALFLSACGTPWKSHEAARTALDQILVSTAADRAAEGLVNDVLAHHQEVPNLGRTYLETVKFESDESDQDTRYALSAVRRKLLDADVALVDDRDQADTIAEIGIGALSVDNTSSLLGIPSISFPIPFVGSVTTPEIAFYKQETNRGLAKIAMSLRDKPSGKIREKSALSVGTAETEKWLILVLFEFVSNDLGLPEEYESIGGK